MTGKVCEFCCMTPVGTLNYGVCYGVDIGLWVWNAQERPCQRFICSSIWWHFSTFIIVATTIEHTRWACASSVNQHVARTKFRNSFA